MTFTQSLKNNLGWKLGSLALSILIWLALASDTTVASSVSVAVQYKNIPTDLEMSSDALERVHLEVNGPASVLTQENLTGLAVVLDLSGVVRPGEKTFPITETSINLPPGVTLERAIPNQIRIRFEGRLQKDVPVLVRFAAPPPEGYEIVSQRVDPEQLAIIGPTSHVEGVEAVQTDPVDLSGVVGTGKFTVQTFIEDPQVRFVSGGQVNVEVEVRRKKGSKD